MVLLPTLTTSMMQHMAALLHLLVPHITLHMMQSRQRPSLVQFATSYPALLLTSFLTSCSISTHLSSKPSSVFCPIFKMLNRPSHPRQTAHMPSLLAPTTYLHQPMELRLMPLLLLQPRTHFFRGCPSISTLADRLPILSTRHSFTVQAISSCFHFAWGATKWKTSPRKHVCSSPHKVLQSTIKAKIRVADLFHHEGNH